MSILCNARLFDCSFPHAGEELLKCILPNMLKRLWLQCSIADLPGHGLPFLGLVQELVCYIEPVIYGSIFKLSHKEDKEYIIRFSKVC